MIASDAARGVGCAAGGTELPKAMSRWSVPFLVFVGCVCATACGSGYPEPRDQLTASESALRAAEVSGAQTSPQSALHLKRAREQIESGKALIKDGENERAEWVLRRARADADLALALATEEAQRKKAAEAREELEKLAESIRQRTQR
jgi:multidrug efflux pump subunit AcrA (membrane-fusion protein)